jgi:hypothetical protein
MASASARVMSASDCSLRLWVRATGPPSRTVRSPASLPSSSSTSAYRSSRSSSVSPARVSTAYVAVRSAETSESTRPSQ